jgi:hypothetical protein
MDGSTGKRTAGCNARVTGLPAEECYLGNEEPPIGELLTDPIAVLLRRSDRLSLQDVCRCIADAMERREHRADEARPCRGS